MDPAAGFRLRHTLHPVDAALILHLGICALACHHEHNLLETSDSVLIDADKLRLPAVALRKMHIHSVKLRGKKGCFVAAGAGTDFHHDVLVIIRIFGKQENLQLLLHFLNSFFRIGQFFLGHITHLLVRLFLEQGQAVFHILVRLLILLICIHKGSQIRLLLHQFPESVLIHRNIRAVQFFQQLFISDQQIIQSVKHGNLLYLSAELNPDCSTVSTICSGAP